MKLEQFLITHGVRAANLMWFLGAGASAAAGIPTASHLIWQFKRTLYCAAERVSLKTCEDLSSASTRLRLQRFFDRQGRFPPADSPEEYTAYFEAAYPDPGDRRSIIEGYVRDARPSYGHLALATLMTMDRARVVWTTNFDKLVEDAAIQMLGGIGKVVVASLDTASHARDAINAGRWPVIAKLHGDFQSRQLKNTSDELKQQDLELRRTLVESCRRFGLIVVGYSGRDESVMRALEDALDSGRGFPAGLFWFHRPDSTVSPAVERLITQAKKLGIQADVVEAYTFDELMGDIIRQVPEAPPKLLSSLQHFGARVTDVAVSAPGDQWPVIRTNALPLTKWPNVCKLVKCSIGGTKEVREAFAKAKAEAIAVRSHLGVLAFGPDEEIRRVLRQYEIREESLHSIEPRRLHFDSAEFGLLRDAFGFALERSRPLRVKSQRRSGSHVCIVDQSRSTDAEQERLGAVTGAIRGTIPNTTLRWAEGLVVKLDFRLGRLWCLLEPTIQVDGEMTAETREYADSFIRERLASRYNRQWNDLLDAWTSIVVGEFPEATFSAFSTNDGLAAAFSVLRTTAFSRKGNA